MAEDGLLFSLRKKSLFFIWPRDFRGRVPVICPEDAVTETIRGMFPRGNAGSHRSCLLGGPKGEEEFTGREKQHLGIRNCKLKGKEI